MDSETVHGARYSNEDGEAIREKYYGGFHIVEVDMND